MSQFFSPHPFTRKSLSQVFLVETWPCQKIVEEIESWSAKRVIEIGPGAGALTFFLLKAGIKVTSVEKDTRFFDHLTEIRKSMPESNKDLFSIVNEDILKFNLEKWLSASGEPAAIVGNIPYSISTQILTLALNAMPHILGAAFMVQLEFGQRLVAPPNSKDYSSLSIYAQLRARLYLGPVVPRHCFKPAPKVDSVLVMMRPINTRIEEDVLLNTESLVRSAFMQRRKKLRNSIASFIRDYPEISWPFDLNRRAEELSPEDYVACGRLLCQAKKK